MTGERAARNPGTRIVPKSILPVRNQGVATQFYVDLGFEVEAYDDGYAWVCHRGAELLHLATAPDLDPTANGAAIYLHVHDADAWHAAWAELAVEVGPIEDCPWGMREFTLHDPDRNLIRIGHNI